MRFRKWTYELLDPTKSGSRAGRYIELGLILLIFLNIVALMAESVEDIHQEYGTFLARFEFYSVMVFTVEYALRVWSSVEKYKHVKPPKARLRYMTSTMGLIDLLAILPFYLTFLPIDLLFIRIIRIFRLFRLLKIARYLKALDLIEAVLRDKKEQIYVSVMFVLFLLVIVSTIMFYVEHDAQPEAFSSIPASMWWGIETLTTVGYGDMLPITPHGKFLGGIISVLGIWLFALPAGILSAGLSDHLLRNRVASETKKCPHCGKDIS